MFAREGFSFIAISTLINGIAVFLASKYRRVFNYCLSGFTFLIWIGMLFFFRDPKRKLPPNGKIVSPVDGKIVEIEEFPDGKKRIAIFLSLLNVHTVRTPMDAVVIKNQFFPGRFFRADRVEAGRDNQYVLLELDTEYGITTLRVISGAVARRVIVYPQKDDALKSGERIGFVRFGSRCEITFPEGFELFVKKGDRLKASVSELGSFNS